MFETSPQAGRIERDAARAAEIARVRALALDRRRREAHVAAIVVEHPGRAAGVGAAVVRREHDDGVVELADRLEEGHQPADVLVDAVEHRRVGFHVPREERAVGGVGVRPSAARAGRRRELRSRRESARSRAGAASAPRGSPSSRRRSGRGTSRGRRASPAAARAPRCARCRGGTAWSRDDARSSLTYWIAALGPVVGRVVVARVLVDRHELVPHHELRREEEVRLALHEAVERVEPALRRPVVLRPRRHGVQRRRVVPLAGHDRLVAGGAQVSAKVAASSGISPE